MTDREVNDIAWRAYLLGVRAAIQAYGVEITRENENKYLNLLGEIADGVSTLQEPGENAARFPDMAESFQRLGNLNVQNDRELAQRIRAGLDPEGSPYTAPVSKS